MHKVKCKYRKKCKYYSECYTCDEASNKDYCGCYRELERKND